MNGRLAWQMETQFPPAMLIFLFYLVTATCIYAVLFVTCSASFTLCSSFSFAETVGEAQVGYPAVPCCIDGHVHILELAVPAELLRKQHIPYC